MNKIRIFLGLLALVVLVGFTSKVNAQNGPVLYFCERYGADGEVSISDRFYTGYLTVMVKCDYALGLRDCFIQFDNLCGLTTDINDCPHRGEDLSDPSGLTGNLSCLLASKRYI